MTVTVAQFRADFPQFQDSSESSISTALTTAGLMVGEVWGELQDRATSLMAAHILTLAASAKSTSGSATSSLAGINIPNEVSLQYSQTPSGNSSAASLNSTAYGKEFSTLQQFVIVPFRIV
jgi:hypothetical protein